MMVSNPGSRLTSRNRFAQMLMGQERAAPPIQSHAQGLASLLRQGLAAYMQGRDERDRAGAFRTMREALMAGPTRTEGDMPQGMFGPGAPVDRSAYENAARALSGMEGNEYAGEIGQQMFMQDAAVRQQREAAERKRRNELEDQETAFQRQQELMALEAGLRPGPAPPKEMQLYQYAEENPGFAAFLAQTGGAAGGNLPASVREYQFFSGLSPEGQERYLGMKRANRPLDLGYGFQAPSQVNPGQPLGQIMPRGVAPDQVVQDGRIVTTPGMPPPAPQAGAMLPQAQAPIAQSQPVPQSADPMPAPSQGMPHGAPPMGAPQSAPSRAMPPAMQSPMVQELPMSPAERREMEAEAQQQQLAQETSERAGGIFLDDIDRALSILDDSNNLLPETGRIGSLVASALPASSDAGRLAGLLDTIASEAAFGRLQAMREASPTGGALGAVSERELDLLRASAGNLRQTQDPEMLKYNLARFKNMMMDTIHGPGNGPPRMDLSRFNAQGRGATGGSPQGNAPSAPGGEDEWEVVQ